MRGGWRRAALIAAIAVAVTLGAIWLLRDYGVPESHHDRARLVYSVLLLVLLLSAGAVRWRARPSLMLRHGFAWIGIALVLALGYSYRSELAAVKNRLVGNLSPTTGEPAGPNAIRFAAGNDGHFRVSATVDGVPFRMLIDTGASVVVLGEEDAVRIGLDRTKLAYTVRIGTANGIVMGAPIRLREIRVGPIAVRDVRGVAVRSPTPEPILGQSFLERLSGYRVSGRTLTLQQ